MEIRWGNSQLTSENTFEVVRGVVSELQVWRSDEDFVFSDVEKKAGGAGALALAADGMAGAATGSLLSSSDTAEKVFLFVCKVGDQIVKGRFGEVTFANGNEVEVAGERRGNHMNAVAMLRPADRTIWMHPHCGRGATAYWRFVKRMTAIASMGAATAFTLTAFLLAGDGDGRTSFPLWFWPVNWAGLAFILAMVALFVARKFASFANLSSTIFSALGFKDPANVDLPKNQKLALKAATNEVLLTYHPHARWVYKY